MPDAIEGNNTEKCDTASAAFQSENNGCVDFVGSEDEIMEQIRQLVCMLQATMREMSIQMTVKMI